DRVVVIIAYHFPPENAIGAARPFRFYKYLLRMGYQCRVITAAPQVEAFNANIEYIPDPFLNESRGLGWHVERAARRILFPGATGLRWAFQASDAIRRILQQEKSDQVTIISTSPPLGVQLAAKLGRRASQSRWIADFRDPLSM